jgi:transcriptional regulator with GAF, ATPase, and Fis domain
MTTVPLLDLSEDQWDFLATMAIFKKPVSIDLLGELIPLSPGPLFDLIRRCEKQGWMLTSEGDLFGLSENLPQNLQEKLQEFSTPDRVRKILEELKNSEFIDQIDPEVLANLNISAGHKIEGMAMLIELATTALDQGQPKTSFRHLESIINYCAVITPEGDENSEFLSVILKASDLSLAQGMFILEITSLLERGLKISEKAGDQRRRALIQLHLGRIYFVSNRRLEAFDTLSLGKSLVEELGDDDIMEQSFELLGVFYFQQGLHIKAIEYFEQALQTVEKNHRRTLSLSTLMLASSVGNTGQFHRAVGILDSHWHQAKQSRNTFMATIMQASLGTILLRLNKKTDAIKHLKKALEAALEQRNGWGLWLAGVSLAVYHFMNGDLTESLKVFEYHMKETEKSGIIRHFVSPLMLELTAAYKQEGFLPNLGFRYDDICQTIMQEPNIHMRGVALRLSVSMDISQKPASTSILEALQQSEIHLLQSGDPVQLSKTHAEMARYYVKGNDIELARKYAQKARRGLSEAMGDRFPEELKFLLERDSLSESAAEITEQTLEESFRIIKELIPRPNFDELLHMLISAMTRLFKAERCGLFWLNDQKAQVPELRVAINLFKTDVDSEKFRNSLSLIFEVYRTNLPLIVRQDDKQTAIDGMKKPAMLCLPFCIDEKPRGVLYLDNSYLENGFANIKNEFLDGLSKKLGAYIERIETYGHFTDKARSPAVIHDAVAEPGGTGTIVSRNRKMNRILTQADRVAKTGATVLILGETGVGKEVLARWIHQKSHRTEQGSLVIIDPTTMPENLVESELFGHEKGAFTGASSRKSGRLELAHNGTLFIDEIGEVSDAIQVKLLRVLQEKSFTRVGGTKTIASDFRLLAATNRDLPKEVEAGRFRKDLYYRLNVMEFEIPPLRKRPEDIMQLANSFLARYTRKYDRPGLRLSLDNEATILAYNWPGNIRELKNVIERAVLMADDDKLEFKLYGSLDESESSPFADNPSFEEIQKRYIRYVLEQTNNRVGEAANILKMNRTTLYTRIKKLGI